jgi:hypothetical protein
MGGGHKSAPTIAPLGLLDKEDGMKTHFTIWTAILALALFGSSCSSGGSPVSPNDPLSPASSGATLFGTVSVSGTNIGLGAVQVNVKGTTTTVTPNANGDFAINNLPLGNPTLDVLAKDVITAIPLQDVEGGEEIRIRLEIRSNGQAHLAHMERHKNSSGELVLAIKPGKWNLNWEESDDEVSASISGEDHDTIVESSVQIFGPDGIRTIDNTALAFEVGGKYFKAWFSQMDAIGLIESPVPGMTYPIKVTGTYGDSEPFELFDTVLILGKYPKDSEELAFQVNPAKWNVNWAGSSGTMMVKFWGDGYDLIDPATVKIIGPEDDEDDADFSNLADDQLIVRFYKDQALGIIPDPVPGDSHTITITDDAASFEFQYVIEIVGKKD